MEQEQEDLQPEWEIAIYRKVGTSYEKFQSATVPSLVGEEDAFGIFGMLLSAYPNPPVSVVIDALGRDQEKLEYEARFATIYPYRVKASVLWDRDIIADCVEDYMSIPRETVTVQIVVDVPVGSTPDEWDWATLALGNLEVLDYSVEESL
jgi:hypothetical protein